MTLPPVRAFSCPPPLVRYPLARLVALLVAAALLLQTACGTILYPERRGQTRGNIDPGVAVMNGVLLILFIVPGIVAFAVDFATGAIYLPPGNGSADAGRTIHLDPEDLTPDRIAEAIYRETGVRVTLSEEDLRALELGSAAEAPAAVAAASKRN